MKTRDRPSGLLVAALLFLGFMMITPSAFSSRGNVCWLTGAKADSCFNCHDSTEGRPRHWTEYNEQGIWTGPYHGWILGSCANSSCNHKDDCEIIEEEEENEHHALRSNCGCNVLLCDM